uniref:Nose resistant-to-fluoxetine protein N-terminal domain-containing protein n=1 Tax=Megaselia scalaris TaxID=36166 RepID=T1GQK5_MEGSC
MEHTETRYLVRGMERPRIQRGRVCEVEEETLRKTTVCGALIHDQARKFYQNDMVDSWGKIPSGLMRGNIFEFGNFEECVNFKRDLPEPFENNKPITILGCSTNDPVKMELIDYFTL